MNDFLYLCIIFIGSFISLGIAQTMLSVQLDDDTALMCSITYESVANQMAANPSLTWSTRLAIDSFQQTMNTNQVQYTSTLNLTRVDSSYCGAYTCTAIDSFIAQASTDTAIVDVGKQRTYKLYLLYDNDIIF